MTLLHPVQSLRNAWTWLMDGSLVDARCDYFERLCRRSCSRIELMLYVFLILVVVYLVGEVAPVFFHGGPVDRIAGGAR